VEAHALHRRRRGERPTWVAGLFPLLLLGAVIALFVALDAPGLERRGVPAEELAVERTVLRPGQIELHLRNDGPDPVRVAQVIVNDRFAPFRQSSESVGRLGATRIVADHPWLEGETYAIAVLTATGATVEAEVEAATATPVPDAGFYAVMALIGVYVGVIPVAIGMLWLPWMRRIDRRWIRFVLALTVGLLAFLAIDATLEGVELAAQGPQAFGGAALVFLGAVVSYLALAGVETWVRGRRSGERASPGERAAPEERAGSGGQAAARGFRVALLVALGIGLHNLGEGLAIGSAYALGALALGATLVVGFALHNTTEGLAIVGPVAQEPPSTRRLVLLGLLAGAPAILGAWIGASAYNPSVAALLLGVGAGAIVQVVVQIVPSIRDGTGRLLDPLTAGGLVSGVALMYVTGLAIPV
jgi:ZIP family zinc transporter